MFKDELGDRIKTYEKVRTSEKLDSSSCVYARIDGRGFSKLTRVLCNKPFDFDFTLVMQMTAETLMKEFGADVAYVQSDEISLGWKSITPPSQFVFDGKLQKLSSTIAAKATAAFIRHYIIWGCKEHLESIHKFIGYKPTFDCRIFEVPSEAELVNSFIWRLQDCKRNAISQWCASFLSHKEMMNKSIPDLIAYSKEKGKDYSSEIPMENQFGSVYYKKLVTLHNDTKGEYQRNVVLKTHINYDKVNIFEWFTKLLDIHKPLD